MNHAPTHPRRSALSAVAALASLPLLSACAGFIDKPARPTLYDLGPVPAPVASQGNMATTLVLQEIEGAGVLDGSSVLYRLDYADAHELRAYLHSRWSAPMPQLVRQRLGQQLGREMTLLNPGEAAQLVVAQRARPLVLRIELQDFSQHFDAPDRSRGQLRLRATVLQGGPDGERPLAQRTVLVSRPAVSQDAPGGVRALSEAVDEAATQLVAWLRETAGH